MSPSRRPHARPRALTAVTAFLGSFALLALGGCGSSDQHTSPTASTSASPSASGTASSDPVARATLMAQQYDYAGAEKALKGIDSPAATQELAKVQAAQKAAKVFPDTQISHIFYHSLIVDPKRALSGPEAKGYHEFMVTMDQFNSELAQMYQRGYVLVHPERVVAMTASGRAVYQQIRLPAGKKPLVLSVDDVNYYEYMTGQGFASNLTLHDGRVENTYVDAAGTTHIGAYDVVPLIDDFVRKHPDFSYHGDKGSIAETGYNGVLGYRSTYRKYGHNAATEAARAQAKKVATAMKAEGWNFASHSYGHINFTRSSLAQIQEDSQHWDQEVRPLVGDTPELVYPFGADISTVTPYSESNPKYHFLHDQEKFTYFFPIDATRSAWMQLNTGSWRQARINIDGISLDRAAREKTVLDQFFTNKA